MSDSLFSYKAESLQKLKSSLAIDDDILEFSKLFSSPLVTYEQYKDLYNCSNTKLHKYLGARNFLLFAQNEKEQVFREDILRYVQRSVDVERTIINLLTFVQDSGIEYISEKEVERYIFDSIPELIGTKIVPESFYPFYVFTSARRFFFFLDPRRTRKLKINSLAHSNIMEEFLFVKRVAQSSHNFPKEKVINNWFSVENARAIYSKYIELDKDRNGMLSERELIGLTSCGVPPSPCQLTSACVSRLFAEYITYTPKEMDYKTFLDLVLAMENKANSQSISYFWRVLDIEKTGYLTKAAIKYFYNDVYLCLKALSYEAPTVTNITTEIFDILGSDDPLGCSFEAFVASGQAPTVITMLTDVHGFWAYDNRESLIQQMEQDEEEARQKEDDLDARNHSVGPGMTSALHNADIVTTGLVFLKEEEDYYDKDLFK